MKYRINASNRGNPYVVYVDGKGQIKCCPEGEIPVPQTPPGYEQPGKISRDLQMGLWSSMEVAVIAAAVARSSLNIVDITIEGVPDGSIHG